MLGAFVVKHVRYVEAACALFCLISIVSFFALLYSIFQTGV